MLVCGDALRREYIQMRKLGGSTLLSYLVMKYVRLIYHEGFQSSVVRLKREPTKSTGLSLRFISFSTGL